MTKKIVIAGITSAIVMAMAEMMYEGLFGIGFWSAPVLIAATVLRSLQMSTLPIAFQFWPVMLGLMGHMMNSVILAAVFVSLIAPRISSTATRTAAGALYGAVVYVVMWFMVLPAVDPVMLNINGAVFAMTHLMWGAILGFIAKPTEV